MIEITCPHCNLSKQVDPAQLPAKATRATCPRCKESFELSLQPTEQPLEPPTEQPAPASEPEAPVAAEPPVQRPAPIRPSDVARLPKAGFWIRVVATLIDGLVVFVLQFALGFLLALAGIATNTAGTDEISGVVVLFGYVLSFTYYIFFTGYCGQTPGKMALRIKVIHCDGGEIGYGRAAYREVVCKTISGLILCIGYLMVAFDEQKQGLHDRMAKTYVIKL